MDNAQFCKQFAFKVISHRSYHHTDNSKGLDRHYIARMRAGKGRIVTSDKQVLLVEKGDVIYMPIGLSYHSYWTPDPKEGRVEWESYGFSLFPSSLLCPLQPLSVDEEASALLDQIAEHLKVTSLTVGSLFLFLDRTLPGMREEEQPTKTALLKKIQGYTENHISFSVPALAKECGMSESGLYAYTKRHTGMTPVELKNRIRVKQAKELFRTTDLSVEEISTRLGFNTAAYLRKLVKQYAGKTPQQLRRETQLL